MPKKCFDRWYSANFVSMFAVVWHVIQTSFAFFPGGPIGPSHAVNRNPDINNKESSLIRFFISGLFVKISFCNLQKSSVILLTDVMLFVIYIIDRYRASR